MNPTPTPYYDNVSKVALLLALGCPIETLDAAAHSLTGPLPYTADELVAQAQAAIDTYRLRSPIEDEIRARRLAEGDD